MSEKAVTTKPADDPAFTLPASLASLSLPLCGGGLLTLVVGVALGMKTDGGTQFAAHAYLTAFLFCVSVVIGSLFFVLIQHLARAGWSVVVRRVAELMMMMIIPMAVLFIPILVFTYSGNLFQWVEHTDAEGVVQSFGDVHHVPAPTWAEKERWLNPTWFTIRSIIYLVVWSGIAVWFFRRSKLQDETGEITITENMQARSGPAVIAFSFCTTFAAFDWGMSLAPMWFSTMFGVYFFTGGILSAHCAIAAMTFLLQKKGAIRDEVTVEHYHDLGKLIFGFICFWGYISFSQYMLIWYANMPEETVWFFNRQTGTYGWISISLIFLHWGLPFLGTMSRHVRRRPALVFFWAVYILAMHFVDMYWVVMPEANLGTGHAMGIASSLLCAIGMGGLLFGLVLVLAGQTKIIPVRDPRLRESIAFENI